MHPLTWTWWTPPWREPLSMAEIRQRIGTPEDTILTLQNTISTALKKIDLDVLKAYRDQIMRHGTNWPNRESIGFVPVFTEIIAPLTGINMHSIAYSRTLPTIMLTFVSLLKKEVEERENEWNKESIIGPSVIERLEGKKGFEVVTSHLRDALSLSQKWFANAGYSEVMKAIEKMLKKMKRKTLLLLW